MSYEKNSLKLSYYAARAVLFNKSVFAWNDKICEFLEICVENWYDEKVNCFHRGNQYFGNSVSGTYSCTQGGSICD